MLINALVRVQSKLASYLATKAFRNNGIGLPGFSRNTNPTVIPPQHILGQMHQPIISTSREKLIDLGRLTMLRTAETQWYEHSIRSWCRSPVYHSFQINHMRAVAEWPDGDPDNIYSWFNICPI
jgi:hypothetical protein